MIAGEKSGRVHFLKLEGENPISQDILPSAAFTKQFLHPWWKVWKKS